MLTRPAKKPPSQTFAAQKLSGDDGVALATVLTITHLGIKQKLLVFVTI